MIDLVIFEERIRQNIGNMQTMRRSLRLRIIMLSFAALFLIIVNVKFIRPSMAVSKGSFLAIFGLLLMYGVLILSTVLLFLAMREWRNSHLKRYEEQCARVLRHFNLQVTRDGERELTFIKRLPKRLADLLDAYRVEYRARRALRSNVKPSKF